MRTLLLADDSITVQRVIALTFADEPIRVVSVSDGQQAMEKLTSLKPDIVLAGTTLPKVNGYELAKFMSGRPDLRGVPVLLLSGAFETVDDALLKSSGANGILEKPVEPTSVIGRVKELLGMKSDDKPAATGRLITSSESPARKPPMAAPPRPVTSSRPTPSKWEQLRDQTGLDADTRSVEDPSTRSDDYLDTLDAAFDNLDQQLSGRAGAVKHQNNPSGPLGQSSGAADPRSPGRRPQTTTPGNPVFEVDDDWFGGNDGKAADRTGRREIQEDLKDPSLQLPSSAAAPGSVFEVDDEWFGADNKGGSGRLEDPRELAAEMGIHDVDLPAVDPGVNGVAPVSDLDFDFGLDDIRKLQDAPQAADAAPVADVKPVVAPAPIARVEPVAEVIPVVEIAPPVVDTPRVASTAERSEALLRELTASAAAPSSPVAPVAAPIPLAPLVPTPLAGPAAPAVAAHVAPAASITVADDFAALLAYEQGEYHEPLPMAATPPPEIKVVAPEITDDMLDQIASRVAERLNAGAFGDQLKTAMTETVRETVRSVVSETSERLVRNEIDRIKNKA